MNGKDRVLLIQGDELGRVDVLARIKEQLDRLGVSAEETSGGLILERSSPVDTLARVMNELDRMVFDQDLLNLAENALRKLQGPAQRGFPGPIQRIPTNLPEVPSVHKPNRAQRRARAKGGKR